MVNFFSRWKTSVSCCSSSQYDNYLLSHVAVAFNFVLQPKLMPLRLENPAIKIRPSLGEKKTSSQLLADSPGLKLQTPYWGVPFAVNVLKKFESKAKMFCSNVWLLFKCTPYVSFVSVFRGIYAYIRTANRNNEMCANTERTKCQVKRCEPFKLRFDLTL